MSIAKSGIVDFYKNKSIFITGATGFLGTSLVEKLLRSFPQVEKIYLLARQKKEVSFEDRYKTYFNKKIFSEVKRINDNYTKKIVWLNGDLSEMNNLGMSKRDLDLIKNEVNVVFHCAASVRFDQPLKHTLIKHLHATNDLLNVFKEGKSLDSFVYVSTLFSNLTKSRKNFLEQLYPPHLEPQEMLSSLECTNTDEMELKHRELIHDCGNSYILSKNITENLVGQYGNPFPIGIFRPGILLASASEPFPNWAQGVNNLLDWTLVEMKKGLVLKINPKIRSAAVPVDMTANAMIASAWDIHNHRGRTGIYNHSCNSNPIDLIKCMQHYADGLNQDELFSLRLEYKQNLKNSAALKIQNIEGFFENADCIFDNRHVQHLWDTISKEEREILPFDVNTLDWREYYKALAIERIQDEC